MAKSSSAFVALIISGPQQWERAHTGLQFALDLKKLEAVNDVQVYFNGPGVELLRSSCAHRDLLSAALEELRAHEIAVRACSAHLVQNGLRAEAEDLRITPTGAGVFFSERIQAGANIVTF